ncbi:MULTISPECIES: MarR family winged helix-turn-helix transcriptional regulator [Flavobacteriaceae]|uniref:MarR family winged helix-turn-helix transcriptional regulator n=1 Tax=Flavobacteriaceae TaxID=49546 RepID=UPI00149155EA|nr:MULTISPECIES: MarR family transcriptional regulator [Allomuricauda]MDC6367162.1 MarR family transcriptional regulator [Muricauda sp. AC10]
MQSKPTIEELLNRIDDVSGMGFHLDTVLRKIQEAYVQRFAELGIEITIEQWVILHQVYKLGEKASQRDIVQLNFRNRATISRVIGGMERKDWVNKTRFEGDQKRFKLELTKEGKKVIDLILPHAIQLRKLTVNRLDVFEFETFLKVLEQIGANYASVTNSNNTDA